MQRAAIAVAVSIFGLAAGVYSLDVAQDAPGYWFGGDSTAGAVALLAAGWALVASGLVAWWRRRESRCAPLFVAGGLAWFAPELTNPGVGSALAFTAGLTLAAATPALIGHAVLAYPSGRLALRAEGAAVALAYVGAVLVLGLLPALFDDPRAQACHQCPRNFLALDDRATAAGDLRQAGGYLGLAWAALLTALIARRVVRASPAARPVFAAGAVYLAAAAAVFAVSLGREFVAAGRLERGLWYGQAMALVALALAVGWGWARARRARSSVARLVVELAQSPPPGGLKDVLAGIVDDPQLVLAYPVGESGALVDPHGRPAQLRAGQERTSLVRDGRPVAILGHAPGRLADEQLVDEVTVAARLALENERLQAEVRARLEELRASRARIVEAGDEERQRVERDLHDGAQQRLVGLSLSLRLLRSLLPPSQQLEQADEELRLAIADLRELAHGIFPAVLADEGFAAAVEALAEEGRTPMRIGPLPQQRLPAPVESAAYTVVAEAARAATSAIGVRAETGNGVLVVEVETESLERLDRVGLQDRIGSLDGALEVENLNGRARIRAELPCES
jgi:signal transduction histidine kinase